jgi:hypothetical protein
VVEAPNVEGKQPSDIGELVRGCLVDQVVKQFRVRGEQEKILHDGLG